MHRCLQLARMGAGAVAPNPMVGAVLVHGDRVIGEGYHEKFREPHAEVNCLASVEEKDEPLISSATLYVSLEPCAHFGKTPPCTDLIIKHKIPRVVIGCRDPFKEVDGKGIEKLEAAGVDVEVGILEYECREVNKRFLCFHEQHRPYIILKWAETANGKIASLPTRLLAERGAESPLKISNEFTDRLVHKWRSEEAAILVGTNTALADDPQLTNRLWVGNNPIRLVVDMDLKLPSHLKIFNDEAPTIVFNAMKHELDEKKLRRTSFYQVTTDVSIVHQIVNALYQLKIQSVIVEGGAKLLQSFIDEGMWDEARVICNRQLTIDNGLAAPELNSQKLVNTQILLNDSIQTFRKLPTND